MFNLTLTNISGIISKMHCQRRFLAMLGVWLNLKMGEELFSIYL
jgi:hypothetical protein